EALSKFPEKEKIDVEFKSFQLEPDTPPYTGQDFYESMAYKFGGVEKTKKMMADVAKQAKERGLDYHFDTMRSEEHTSELQSRFDLVCRLLLEKKKNTK